MSDIEEAKNLLLRERHETYDMKGRLERVYYTSGQNFDGNYKTYFKKGKIANDINYKMGQLHGSFKMWNRRGSLEVDRLYKDGLIIEDYLDE